MQEVIDNISNEKIPFATHLSEMDFLSFQDLRKIDIDILKEAQKIEVLGEKHKALEEKLASPDPETKELDFESMSPDELEAFMMQEDDAEMPMQDDSFMDELRLGEIISDIGQHNVNISRFIQQQIRYLHLGEKELTEPFVQSISDADLRWLKGLLGFEYMEYEANVSFVMEGANDLEIADLKKILEDYDPEIHKEEIHDLNLKISALEKTFPGRPERRERSSNSFLARISSLSLKFTR